MLWDGIAFILLVAVPVIIAIEFFIFMGDKKHREEKAERARIKRELNRKNHPSNLEGEE